MCTFTVNANKEGTFERTILFLTVSVITAVYTTGLTFTVLTHMPDAKARKTDSGLGNKREDRVSAVKNGNIMRKKLSRKFDVDRAQGKIFNFRGLLLHYHTTRTDQVYSRVYKKHKSLSR